MSPTIFASCDSVYLRQFAPSLLASCAIHKNDVWLHLIYDNSEDIEFAEDLIEKTVELANNQIQVILSTQQDNLHNKIHYACNRFLVTSRLLRDSEVNPNVPSLMITDVDAFLMDHIESIDADVGLFLREPLPGTIGWEQQGTRVAAGAVFYRAPSAMPFAVNVEYEMSKLPVEWFRDQVALNTTYEKFKDTLRFHVFDNSFMDWEFRPGTKIWTGKGPRKYENPKYLEQKKLYEDMLK